MPTPTTDAVATPSPLPLSFLDPPPSSSTPQSATAVAAGSGLGVTHCAPHIRHCALPSSSAVIRVLRKRFAMRQFFTTIVSIAPACPSIHTIHIRCNASQQRNASQRTQYKHSTVSLSPQRYVLLNGPEPPLRYFLNE
jgi:hypothetical protein